MMSCVTYVCYIPHAITFLLAGAIVAAALDCVRLTYRKLPCCATSQIFYIIMFFQIVTIVLFTVNQVGWLVNNHDTIVGQSAQIGWLAYDYFNKIFHLTVAVGVNLWLRIHPDKKVVERVIKGL